ncbi:hypothetical protein DPEC_G00126280 [Dallia pectoralis]|uniref:Uncharacterized protein n=1 Tax=Dallia pectoralis TaxID=75939 RepID=A0ACC2GRJ2_DALPE|nr:hypothetical protein DPEC_G00126280 [Dallia pectoralis]
MKARRRWYSQNLGLGSPSGERLVPGVSSQRWKEGLHGEIRSGGSTGADGGATGGVWRGHRAQRETDGVVQQYYPCLSESKGPKYYEKRKKKEKRGFTVLKTRAE